MLHKLLINSWRNQSLWLNLLLPFELIYKLSNRLDFLCKTKIRQAKSLDVPLIILGGITIGGAGKTPAVIALTRALEKRGFKVGIISRGYKSSAKRPLEVSVNSKMGDIGGAAVGDEPLLIACSTKCPVFIGANRHQVATSLLARHKVDVIISDDGLQHYGLRGDLTLVVIDGAMGVSNSHCLPVGPLREPVARLNKANFVLFNLVNTNNILPDKTSAALKSIKPPQFMMKSKSVAFVKVTHDLCSNKSTREYSLTEWQKLNKDKRIHALAGIAQPQNFFALLEHNNIHFTARSFPNHYNFQPDDIANLDKANDGAVILMTEKDAVKCAEFSAQQENMWALRINYYLDEKMIQQILALL